MLKQVIKKMANYYFNTTIRLESTRLPLKNFHSTRRTTRLKEGEPIERELNRMYRNPSNQVSFC